MVESSLYGMPRTIYSEADPFTDAKEFTETSNLFIESQIKAINDISASTLASATDAIAALGNTPINIPDYDVSAPVLVPDIAIEVNIPSINPEFWGRIDGFTLGDPGTVLMPTIGTVTVPDFEPTKFTIQLPPPPDPIAIPNPSGPPGTPVLVFPPEPVIGDVNMPALVEVIIPPFTVPTIDDFVPNFPEFSPTDINTLIDWVPTDYEKLEIEERNFSNIEDALFSRGRDREDREVLKEEQQATDEWAAKGYTAPPGMLVKRIDTIRSEGMIKKLGLNREMIIKFHQDDIDNWRFIVQQGLVAEGLFVQVLIANNTHMFEAQKLSLEIQVQFQNMLIQVFLARMEEVKIRASVYETQVRAKMMDIEVFKALIEGEKAKAVINQALVSIYATEVQARESYVRMYGEQLKAVGYQVDIFNAQINAHKAEVEVFAARIDADKNRFDAYASQIRGEAIKPDILAAEARAYASVVDGVKIGVDAEVAALQGAVAAGNHLIQAYDSKVRGLVGKAQTQLGQIQANVAGNNANTQRFIAKVGAEEVHDKVQLAAWEGANRTNLEIFKADVVSFEAKLESAVKKTELAISSQASAGQLAATITAGALSAAHVGASLSSGSGVTASGNVGYSASSAEAVSHATSNTANISSVSTLPFDLPPAGFSGRTTIY